VFINTINEKYIPQKTTIPKWLTPGTCQSQQHLRKRQDLGIDSTQPWEYIDSGHLENASEVTHRAECYISIIDR